MKYDNVDGLLDRMITKVYVFIDSEKYLKSHES